MEDTVFNLLFLRTITSADDILRYALEYNRKKDRPNEPSFT